MPRCRRVRRANSVCAHPFSNASTCCTTENFLLIVTRSSFIDSTRLNPGMTGGGITMDRLLLSGTKTISTNLVRFSRKVLPRAMSFLDVSDLCCTRVCITTRRNDQKCVIGIFTHLHIYILAYLSIELPGVAAWRSEAVTTQDAGPMPDPCIIATIFRNSCTHSQNGTV